MKPVGRPWRAGATEDGLCHVGGQHGVHRGIASHAIDQNAGRRNQILVTHVDHMERARGCAEQFRKIVLLTKKHTVLFASANAQ